MNIWMRNKWACGLVYAPDHRIGGSAHEPDWFEDVSAAEEFDVLMSLALDDALTQEQEAEFARILSEDSELDHLWADWQAFDLAFRTAPSAEPPVDFVAGFEERLLKQERRRRLWFGASVGALAFVLWGTLVMGLAGAGAYVMFNQPGWLISSVRLVAQASVTVQSQVDMFVAALSTALAAPQVQGMAVAYVVFSGLALWFWAWFLRRSVNEQRTATASAS
jgi:hypothetical protein